MIKKLFKGISLAAVIAILPVLGNIKMLHSFQLWIGFAIGMLVLVLQPEYKFDKDKQNSSDKGTEAQIFWSVILTQLSAIAEAAYLRYPGSVKWDLIAALSLCPVIFGLFLRTWAVYTLGKFFTLHLSLHKEHKVIRAGPYGFIRHPSYVGSFLIFSGMPAFLHSWYSLILAAVLLPVAYARRMHYEETMLVDKIGDDYIKYSAEVKSVIPGLL